MPRTARPGAPPLLCARRRRLGTRCLRPAVAKNYQASQTGVSRVAESCGPILVPGLNPRLAARRERMTSRSCYAMLACTKAPQSNRKSVAMKLLTPILLLALAAQASACGSVYTRRSLMEVRKAASFVAVCTGGEIQPQYRAWAGPEGRNRVANYYDRHRCMPDPVLRPPRPPTPAGDPRAHQRRAPLEPRPGGLQLGGDLRLGQVPVARQPAAR